VIDKAGAPFVSAEIPANTYGGQTAAVNTAAVVNYLVTHEGVKEELVYQMTKNIFENLGELGAAHSAGKAIKLEGALEGMPIPLHPGAARYLKEKGLKVGS